MRPVAALLAALFFLLAAAGAAAQPRPRIVNGTTTGEYPGVGALLIHESPIDPTVTSLCTGTLIGCRSFLTAAHCVCPFTSDNAAECLRQGLTDPRRLSALLQNAGRFAVSDIALHPEYEFTEGGDLALLTLAEPVAVIEPVQLNDISRPQLGSDGTIAGFGNSGGPEFEQNDLGIKRMGSVRTSLCPSDINPNSHVCWDFFAVGSNTCGGDSGGPLFIDFGDGFRLAGITSGGENPTCLAPDAGFDTDISVHRDWLYEALAASEDGAPCPHSPVVGSPGVVVTGFDGVLKRGDTVRSLPITVAEGTRTLIVVLNGALYSSDGASTPNEFSLSLRRAGASTADCVDSTLGPFGTCRVDDPAPGAWEARIGRLRGFGEFQLTATTLPGAGCVGDCNGDGSVSDAELAAVVRAVFDDSLREACPTLDADGAVTAGEIVRAVGNRAAACAG